MKRRSIFLALLATSAALVFQRPCGWAAEASPPLKYRVYFGSQALQEGQGIYSGILDAESGRLDAVALAGEAFRSRVIALHPTKQYLYSIGKPASKRLEGRGLGAVCAFRINPENGTLAFLNSQSTRGVGPCFVTVDPSGRNLLAVNYQEGSAVVLPLAEDGSLRPVSSIQRHTGTSIHPRRQNKPHPHIIRVDPAGRFAFVADLGTDKIMIYGFDAVRGILTPHSPSFVKVKAGGGPRHFTFDPSGRFAYANLELSNDVIAFRYDSKRGALATIQSISSLPTGYEQPSYSAGIRTSPDGRFLYVSNRGHDSIAVFSIDPGNGKLTVLEYAPTKECVPQTINIDPSGGCLIATDHRAGVVKVFRRDRASGRLSSAEEVIPIPGAGSTVFVPLER